MAVVRNARDKKRKWDQRDELKYQQLIQSLT